MIYPENVIPPVDSARNQETRDVAGGKGDTHDGDSLYSLVKNLVEHVHMPSLVYPSLVVGIDVTAGAAGPPWVLGGFTEIVPNGVIGSDFDIHHVSVEGLDDNSVYQLHLYAVEVFIGSCRFTKNANLDTTMNIPIQGVGNGVVIPAGTQIQAKLASEVGGSIARISLFYHEY